MNEHWHERPVHRGFDEIAGLYPLIDGRGYVGGSFAAWMCSPLGDPALPQDIDIFATSSDHARAIADDICSLLEDYYSDNEIVFSIPGWIDRRPIQVVRPSPGWTVFPDDILNSFDLSVSRAILVAPDKVLADVDAGWKTSKLLRTHNPVRTLKRILKYAGRGVEFADHELIKVLLAWEQLSIARRDELIEAAQPPEPGDPPPDYGSFLDDDDWFEGE